MNVIERAEKDNCPVCQGRTDEVKIEDEDKLCLDCWIDHGFHIDYEGE